ncbi:MAG: Crp/Fnr family transcriptional regulator [Cyanobacteriota bacterium]|nr:Crp/Fnr family transcriptional regulator [Cyanobacteriota bacterium]
MASCFRILEEIDADLRDRLLHDHRVLSVPANHQLIFESDWGNDVYLLSEGIAKSRNLNPQGEETVISLMGPGSLIGDLAIFSTLSLRTVDVVSLTAATLFKLRRSALREAMDDSPAFMHVIACLQAQRLCALGERLMLMNEDATTRLLASLSLLARLNGPEDDPLHPIPALSQQEIAVISGLSRGTASTLINKLRGNGILEQTDQGLRFTSLTPLQRRGLLPQPTPPSRRG